MEVIGSLFKTTDLDKGMLPIPWTSRAHLALETGSTANFAITKSANNQSLPEMLVSPLKIRNFQNHKFLAINVPEQSGALADVLSTLKIFNIAVSETLTIDGRSSHYIHVVIENASATSRYIAMLKALRINPALTVTEVNPSVNVPKTFLFCQSFEVQAGYIKDTRWNERIIQHAWDRGIDLEQFEMDKLVVSSNTEARLIRYIIPKKGVREIRLPHEDVKGATHELAECFRLSNLNILSSRVSKIRPAGLGPEISTFCVVCEPEDPVQADDSYARLDKMLTESRRQNAYQLSTDPNPSTGRPAHDVIFLKPKDARYIAPPTRGRTIPS